MYIRTTISPYTVKYEWPRHLTCPVVYRFFVALCNHNPPRLQTWTDRRTEGRQARSISAACVCACVLFFGYSGTLQACEVSNFVYRVAQKIGTIFLYALILSNVNRFSKLFHCQNLEKICNNIITKDPTTPQVCCYMLRHTKNCAIFWGGGFCV